jgi:hypothetical protein
MAWNFGDSFDLYAAAADAANGYWDSYTAGYTLIAGRFSGSQAVNLAGTFNLVKTSGVNDAVHHFVCSFNQTAAISGSTLAGYFELFDGATAQCSVVFRSDGAILLTSGAPAGTVLATYTGAFPVTNTWYAFEIEVVINNTTGSFTVRKNGNTVADFTASGLNTRNSANNYANKLQFGSAGATNQRIDDLFWRSDASSVAWLGDIRCFTRMPASDASVQFTPSSSAFPLTPFPAAGNNGWVVNRAFYTPFTPSFSGTVGSITLPIAVTSTANIKCAIYSTISGVPGIALGSATPISAPGVGTAVFTFGTPVAVTAGTQYWAAFVPDATSGSYGNSNTAGGYSWSSATYSTFPTNNPSAIVSGNQTQPTINVTPATTANFAFVAEPQQDTTTTYVYDSTAGHADLYGIGSIASTPASTIAVTTRGYMQKSDAGSRTAAVQLKSGATTVASPTLTLTTSGWLWAWRTDTVDPNTSAAWTAAAVNAATIGPVVVT